MLPCFFHSKCSQKSYVGMIEHSSIRFPTKEALPSSAMILMELEATQKIPKQLKAKPKEFLQKDNEVANDMMIPIPLCT